MTHSLSPHHAMGRSEMGGSPVHRYRHGYFNLVEVQRGFADPGIPVSSIRVFIPPLSAGIENISRVLSRRAICALIIFPSLIPC